MQKHANAMANGHNSNNRMKQARERKKI